eukprot:superscaffoldBa00000711_g6716
MSLPICPASLPYDLVADKARGPAVPSAWCQHFPLIQKEEEFDDLSEKGSPELVTRASGRAERLLTPHSHPSIPSSIPPSPSVLFTLCSPCGRATSETLQTTKVLAVASDWPVTAFTMGTTRERCWSGWGSGADGGLVVGIFYAVDQARE